MKKYYLSLSKKILVLIIFLTLYPINRFCAETISITDKTAFLDAMNNANDGDIIKLENDISLIAGDSGAGDCFNIPGNCLVILDLNGNTIHIGSGSASNNFGIGSNSALLIKNGSIENIDTNDTDAGVLILSGVTITNNICTGSTQIWIVNNSSVDNLLVVESGGKINPGADANMNPLSYGVANAPYTGHENPAPAMVGSGVTWKCLNTLQDDFEEANNDTTGTYTNIIFLKDSVLEQDSHLTAGGININLGGYTLTTGDHILSLDHTSGINKINSGTIDGDLLMNDSSGEVSLSSLDVTGTIKNGLHLTTINSSHYNNIIGGSGTISINNGFYSGNLTGSNYKISNGYFVNKPNPSYIIASKAAVKCNVNENGITYYYTIGDHVHTWEYFAENNILYAYCTGDSDCAYFGSETSLNDSIKLVLSSPNNCIYNGSPIEATYNESNSNIESWKYFFGDLPVIKYEAKPGSALSGDKAVDVGSYTAYISVGTGIDEKKSKIDFTIIEDNPVSYFAIPNTGIE